MKTADDVLKFWFVDHGQEDWFGAKPEFDELIAQQFSETHAAASRGEAWRWRTTPKGRLAEIIVLDQFSRQLFRGRREAFALDPIALTLAQEAVAGGHHNFLPAMPQRLRERLRRRRRWKNSSNLTRQKPSSSCGFPSRS